MNASSATLGEGTATSSTPGVDTTIGDVVLIDVRKLMAELSVEELCRTAESYLAAVDYWEFHH